MSAHHAQEVSIFVRSSSPPAGVFALGLVAPADASPLQIRGSVHINFVRYDPAGPDTGTNAHINKEIVVIKNSTGKARILTGWTLRDPAGHVYHFPQTRRDFRSADCRRGGGVDLL